MNDILDDAMREYCSEIDDDWGYDITEENYGGVIAILKEEEEKSHGIVKNDAIVKFLERWFGK
jgi:hypothetical protein